MAWTRSGTVYTNDVAARSAAVAPRVVQGNIAVKLSLAAPADNVKAMIRCSPSGGSGWELGIEGANVVIQTRAFGGAPSVAATAAHGLAAGVPFTLLAQLTGTTYEVFLNGSTSPAVSHTPSPDAFARYRRVGFVSAVNGARVLQAEICGIVATRAISVDVAVLAIDGNVFLTEDGRNWSQIAAGMFNTSGPVDLEEFEGAAWGVDGTNFVRIDPLTRIAARVIPTAGTLPGQIGSTPGSTRATICRAYGPRLGLMGDPQDAHNATFCAIRTSNQGFDWNTAAVDAGAAFSFNAAFPGKIGEPILSFKQGAGGGAVIGCVASIWRFEGDPAIGVPSLTRVNGAVGVSGKDALELDDRGRIPAHTPDGVYIVPREGDAVPLSALVLTEGIQIPREELAGYRVQVRQDSPRHGMMFYLTPVEGDGASLAFFYDQDVGGWTPGAGGFLPDDIPERMGPTASCVFLGKILMGGRDGHVYAPSTTPGGFDDGDPIVCRFPSSLLLPGDTTAGVELVKWALTLGEDSDPLQWQVYGGRTAQEALTGTGRKLLYAGTARADQPSKPEYGPLLAPFLVIDMAPATAGGRVLVEELQAQLRKRKAVGWHSRAAGDPPPEPCRTADDLVHPTPGVVLPEYPTLPPTAVNDGSLEPPAPLVFEEFVVPPSHVNPSYVGVDGSDSGVVEF